MGHITTLTSLVLQRQNAAFGEGALDGNQGFTRQSRDRVRSTGNHGGRAFQAVEIILAVPGKHGPDFQQRGLHLLPQRSVGEVVHELSADGECARLLGGEHHRRKMVAPDQAVADARLGHDGNACLTKGGNVAIDRANAEFEMRGEIFSPHDPSALQAQHHRHQTVHPVHGRQDSTSVEKVGGLLFPPKRWTAHQRPCCKHCLSRIRDALESTWQIWRGPSWAETDAAKRRGERRPEPCALCLQPLCAYAEKSGWIEGWYYRAGLGISEQRLPVRRTQRSGALDHERHQSARPVQLHIWSET